MPTDPNLPESYSSTLELIKNRVHEARFEAFRAVNKELIELYWFLGKVIYEKQQSEKWGSSIVGTLSKDLQLEFPGMKGFRRTNLYKMSMFYQSYKDNEIVQTLSVQIGWSHNVAILQKCSDAQEREFYIKMTIKRGWSTRALEEFIKRKEFERWVLGQSNFEKTLDLPAEYKSEILIKDDYNLDFLEITEKIKERELENGIVTHIVDFLAELGGDLSFVGRQYPITVDENEFFIDILFYHRKLRSLLAIELKASEFKPEYVGKMQFYLAALDKYHREEGENPSIGLIVCKKKNREIVDLTLQVVAKPIGVATYKTYSEAEHLPELLQKYLPTKDVIARKLLAV